MGKIRSELYLDQRDKDSLRINLKNENIRWVFSEFIRCQFTYRNLF